MFVGALDGAFEVPPTCFTVSKHDSWDHLCIRPQSQGTKSLREQQTRASKLNGQRIDGSPWATLRQLFSRVHIVHAKHHVANTENSQHSLSSLFFRQGLSLYSEAGPGSDPNRSTCCCTSPQLASLGSGSREQQGEVSSASLREGEGERERERARGVWQAAKALKLVCILGTRP